jgi:excisionase family DNA binding protein
VADPADTALRLELPAGLVEAVAQRAADLVLESFGARVEDRWMNVDQAAAYLACGPRRIYDLHSQRRLRSHKDGSRLLFRRSDLDAYVESGS